MIFKRSIKFITKGLLVIAVVIASCFLYIFFSYGFSDSLHYTPKDWILYNFYTIEEVKNAPYLTDSTAITFYAQDGPSYPGYRIRYNDQIDIKELEDYLSSLGYREKPDPLFGTLWYSQSGDKEANVYDAGETTVMWFNILYY